MPTYHQNRNSTYSRAKYQTFKTYQVKAKLPEEPKTLEPVQQTLAEPKPENDTTNNPQSKSQHKKSKIQLYSARDRQRVRHEIVEQQFQTPATASTNDDEDSEYQIPEWEIEKGEKDSHQLEDDGRESVSNVSTAMTDSKHESCCSHTAEMIESGAEVLFDINLATEDGVMNVKIYYDNEEEDYQEILEQLCKVQKFDARMGLYFKINMYQLIKDRRGQGCKEVDDALGRLLEINYKLIMYESGLGQADQVIAPYVC